MSDFDWDALEEEMSDNLNDLVAADVANVALLSDVELLNRFHETTDQLRERSEMLKQHTEAGRDLMSVRSACRIELARRKLL